MIWQKAIKSSVFGEYNSFGEIRHFLQKTRKSSVISDDFLETVEKPLRGFPTGWMQPVAQTHRPPAADDSHTYGLRSIFSGAHVTGENDLILFRASERETLRGFFDTLFLFRLFIAFFIFHAFSVFFSAIGT